jgi:hypothetical membrane protein
VLGSFPRFLRHSGGCPERFHPSYSLLHNRVSDLGNTTCGPWLTYPFACSPLHDLVNTAFVATGVLFVLGAALTWNAWPRRRFTTAGLVCIALAGVGYMLVGLNPENVNVRLHILDASNLLTSNLALLLLGLSTRAEHSWRAKLALGLAGVGLLGLLGGPLLLATLQHGGGLSERLVLYPCVVCVVVARGCSGTAPVGCPRRGLHKGSAMGSARGATASVRLAGRAAGLWFVGLHLRSEVHCRFIVTSSTMTKLCQSRQSNHPAMHARGTRVERARGNLQHLLLERNTTHLNIVPVT